MIIIIIIYNAPFRYDKSAVARSERALRYIFKDKSASYQDLLQRIRLPSMETRRIQDMLLTISNSISDKAHPELEILSPYAHPSILFEMIISFHYLKLTRLNIVSYYGDILPLRNGASYQMILKLKQTLMK